MAVRYYVMREQEPTSEQEVSDVETAGELLKKALKTGIFSGGLQSHFELLPCADNGAIEAGASPIRQSIALSQLNGQSKFVLRPRPSHPPAAQQLLPPAEPAHAVHVLEVAPIKAPSGAPLVPPPKFEFVSQEAVESYRACFGHLPQNPIDDCIKFLQRTATKCVIGLFGFAAAGKTHLTNYLVTSDLGDPLYTSPSMVTKGITQVPIVIEYAKDALLRLIPAEPKLLQQRGLPESAELPTFRILKITSGDDVQNAIREFEQNLINGADGKSDQTRLLLCYHWHLQWPAQWLEANNCILVDMPGLSEAIDASTTLAAPFLDPALKSDSGNYGRLSVDVLLSPYVGRGAIPNTRFFELLFHARYFAAPRKFSKIIALLNDNEGWSNNAHKKLGLSDPARKEESISRAQIMSILSTQCNGLLGVVQLAFDCIMSKTLSSALAKVQSAELAALPGRASIVDKLRDGSEVKLMVTSKPTEWLEEKDYNLGVELGNSIGSHAQQTANACLREARTHLLQLLNSEKVACLVWLGRSKAETKPMDTLHSLLARERDEEVARMNKQIKRHYDTIRSLLVTWQTTVLEVLVVPTGAASISADCAYQAAAHLGEALATWRRGLFAISEHHLSKIVKGWRKELARRLASPSSSKSAFGDLLRLLDRQCKRLLPGESSLSNQPEEDFSLEVSLEEEASPLETFLQDAAVVKQFMVPLGEVQQSVQRIAGYILEALEKESGQPRAWYERLADELKLAHKKAREAPERLEFLLRGFTMDKRTATENMEKRRDDLIVKEGEVQKQLGSYSKPALAVTEVFEKELKKPLQDVWEPHVRKEISLPTVNLEPHVFRVVTSSDSIIRFECTEHTRNAWEQRLRKIMHPDAIKKGSLYPIFVTTKIRRPAAPDPLSGIRLYVDKLRLANDVLFVVIAVVDAGELRQYLESETFKGFQPDLFYLSLEPLPKTAGSQDVTINIGRKRQLLKLFAERAAALSYYFQLDDDIDRFEEHQYGSSRRLCSMARALRILQRVLEEEVQAGVSMSGKQKLFKSLMQDVERVNPTPSRLQRELKELAPDLAPFEQVTKLIEHHFPSRIGLLNDIVAGEQSSAVIRELFLQRAERIACVASWMPDDKWTINQINNYVRSSAQHSHIVHTKIYQVVLFHSIATRSVNHMEPLAFFDPNAAVAADKADQRLLNEALEPPANQAINFGSLSHAQRRLLKEQCGPVKKDNRECLPFAAARLGWRHEDAWFAYQLRTSGRAGLLAYRVVHQEQRGPSYVDADPVHPPVNPGADTVAIQEDSKVKKKKGGEKTVKKGKSKKAKTLVEEPQDETPKKKATGKKKKAEFELPVPAAATPNQKNDELEKSDSKKQRADSGESPKPKQPTPPKTILDFFSKK